MRDLCLAIVLASEAQDSDFQRLPQLGLLRGQLPEVLRLVQTEHEITCQGELEADATNFGGAPALQHPCHIPEFEIQEPEGVSVGHGPRPCHRDYVEEAR